MLFIRDLPPVSTHDLTVTQPAIYYGELPNDHVFVNTQTQEFDYPRGAGFWRAVEPAVFERPGSTIPRPK